MTNKVFSAWYGTGVRMPHTWRGEAPWLKLVEGRIMQNHCQSDLIEVGWVIVGHLEATDKKAVLQARDTLLAYCRDTFAAFTWDMPLVEREGWGLSYPAEPAALLEYGMIERDVRHWDFARLAHFG